MLHKHNHLLRRLSSSDYLSAATPIYRNMATRSLTKPGDIELVPTQRHVRVFDKSGTLLADSTSPVELYEYRCPVRFYLPSDDVKWDTLEKADQTTFCPYKGTADRYWRTKTNSDAIAWGYSEPLAAVGSIKDLVAFYNERLKVEVDGEPLK